MLSALRRFASRVRTSVRRRTSGVEPDQGLNLFDLPRLNAILAAGGLPPLARPPAPDAVVGEWPLRVFELAPELREGIPLGLTPLQREELLCWAIHTSSGAHRVTADQMLALFAHLDTLPDRGLELTYRLTPEWQEAVPDALTRPGWKRLKEYLRTRYKLHGGWFDWARLGRPERQTPPGLGVNVLAHFDYSSGLQQAAEVLVAALQRAGYRTALRDLPVHARIDPTAARKLDFERFDTTILVSSLHTSGPEWYRRTGLWMRPGVRRIAMWYWELDEVPAEWVPHMQWADEVWASTRFMADAYRRCVRVPTLAVLPGLVRPTFNPLPRSRFGLTEGRFVVLFAFDMASRMPRKNPLGLIHAFRRVFRPDEPVDLVIKTSRGGDYPDEFAELRQACEANAVKLIDHFMPRGDLLALVNCCDCYASLHRSEGLGLGMAEAMALGKPVVATAYSGNVDFMSDDTGYLVRAGRVACGPGAPPYPPEMLWADPDLDHAAELLRRVYDHRDEARTKGDRAARDVRDHLSIDAYSRRLAAALAHPATHTGDPPCSSSILTSTSP